MCGQRTKPTAERPSVKSLGWVRAAVDCDGLAYESASLGWVAERSIATVLKTVVGVTPPGVRIPPHPPENKHAPAGRLFYGSVGRMRNPRFDNK